MRVILAVMAVAACLTGEAEARTAPHGQALAPLPAGSPIRAGIVSIQIDQVSNSQGIGNPVMMPAPGALMIVVTFTVKNITGETVGVGDVPDLALYQGRTKLVLNREKTDNIEDMFPQLSYAGFGEKPRFLNPGVSYRDIAIFDVAKDNFDPAKMSIGLDIGGQTSLLPQVKHWPEDRTH